MDWEEKLASLTYSVVVNDEGQYSIWAVSRPIPDGWRSEGPTGDREKCLAYIDETWVDMRPISLRRYMESSTTADSES